MANDIAVFAKSQLPKVFQAMNLGDDLDAGVSGSFAVMSFRSSRWRVKYQKEETVVRNADGDPRASIDVVIVKANPRLSKNYYEQGYAEGAAEAPDCFSMDGERPDAGAPKKQSTNCASCSKNVFGSRITPAGKKAKACQDNRRLAIVPLDDLKNEIYGGPMLLRVPAASLADLALLGKKLRAQGFPYTAVAIRIGFDDSASYPKLTFKAVRPLTDDEAQVVAEHLQDTKVERILAESVELKETAVAVEEEEGEQLFIQPTAPAPQPVVAKPAPAAAAPKPAAVKSTAVKPTPAPVQEEVTVSAGSLDDDIRSILGDLGDLS